MKLSVVIPTINRYTDLYNTVKCIMNQDFTDYEVIIVDQSDTIDQEIVERIKENTKINYDRIGAKSASASRNHGIVLSKGEVILFIDDDVIVEDRNFLSYHYRHYEDEDIHGVIGCPLEQSLNQIPRYDRHWMSRRNFEVGWLYFPSNFGCNALVGVGRSNNLSVRKSSAINIGGMDENYEKGAHREEADFCIRMVRKFGPFLFDPAAKLIHIGNQKGGIRSWNDSRYIKAQHNLVGAIYFDLKMAKPIYYLDYFTATLRYFAINKTILTRPALYFPLFKRFIRSLYQVISLRLKGPIYLSKEM